MPFFLKHRNSELQELMDDSDCDPVKLSNTYRQFWWINRFLSKWNRIYKNDIRPILINQNGSASLLDIGFGGGDIPIQLDRISKKDGFKLQITAIEADSRSLDFVRKLDTPSNIYFENTLSTDILRQGKEFNFVISNHVIHHLDSETLLTICKEAEQLATKKVIFNDLRRSDWAYLLFFIFSKLLFRNSFVSVDGLISIKRSYTFKELSAIAPDGWSVERLFPFRLVLSYEP
jgi:2-polyprenyl-3-methyl-5-hydroxy-6-metoxy-1,4-benzoquinol methylase